MNDPKNLDYKIGLLLEDLEQVDKEDARKLIKQFAVSLLEWQDVTHPVDQYDLEFINSVAVQNMQQLPVDQLKRPELDLNKIRALCFLESCISFLRSKSLTSVKTVYKKKGKNLI